MEKIKPVVLGILLLALFGIFLLDISVGSVKIPFSGTLKILFGARVEKESWSRILTLFRLPKAITALLAGAALAVSGLQMQTLFRNPLAGPFILGISSGAGLGVAIVVLSAATGGAADFLYGIGLFGQAGIVIASGLGSALILLLVLLLSRRIQNVITLLILGLLFGYAANALVSILVHFSIAERIQAYISWTFGSFSRTTWGHLKLYIPIILAGLAVSQLTRKPLNALLLGETYAKSMGLRIRRARIIAICSTAVLTGTVTAFCGPIAFLGVAIPHLCRSLFNTSDHRILLPTSIIIGSLAALLADLLSQLPGTQIMLPLNAVTALFGAPIIAWVIIRRRNLKETFAA
jgi:iron complex transport system permease protein